MRVSYNEIYTNVKKACIAVGVPIGVAEDIARSVTNGMESGMDYLEQITVALDKIYDTRSATYDPDQALRGLFISSNPDKSLSALNSAPSACDLTVLEPKEEYSFHQTEFIKLSQVDVPSLVIFEALRMSRDLQKDECIWWEIDNINQCEGVCLRGKLMMLQCSYKVILECQNRSMTMKKMEKKKLGEGFKEHVGTLDNENISRKNWDKITSYSNMLLVRTSEESRMKGAGAGVVDRD